MLINKSKNLNELVTKGLGVFSIRVLSYLFGFAFTWILANKYGPRFQGIFSIAFLFLSIGAMISKLGVETAIVKWMASVESSQNKKYVFFKSLSLVLFMSCLIGLVVYFCAPLISQMYNKPDLINSIKVASIGIPFLAILDLNSNYFKGENKVIIFGTYFYFFKFLFPLLLILCFYLLTNSFIEAPTLSYTLGLFMACVVSIMHIVFTLKKTKRKLIKKFSYKYIVIESYPMMVSSAIVMIMGWSDVFILGFYTSEEKIGVYSTAIKIATTVSFIYSAITAIITPKIATFYGKNEQKKLIEIVNNATRIIFFSSLPVFMILFCFPNFILGLFGPEYIEGSSVLRILLIAQFTNAITGPVGPLMQMSGNQKVLQNIIALSLVFNILISLILVSRMESIGVAIGSAVGMALWNIVGAYYIFKKMKVQTWVTF